MVGALVGMGYRIARDVTMRLRVLRRSVIC